VGHGPVRDGHSECQTQGQAVPVAE